MDGKKTEASEATMRDPVQLVSTGGEWVSDANATLLTDLYELTMAQGYWKEGMRGDAVFTLFCRRLPRNRNYLLACGLEDALRFLEGMHFTDEALSYLATLPFFSGDFLAWLGEMRFTGDVYAVPEGTPVFADEPIVEVVAPIAEAQLVETMVINQVHFQTVAASKAARVVAAAEGRAIVDFGLRRTHGADAGLKSARAFYIAGVESTSNVLAGQVYGIPVSGTMAHSYIQAHDSELEAFRAFLRLYPETIVLVDTYDTPRGVEKVIALARELGDDFRARGIRLDSGDLAELAIASRRMLDAAGLQRVEIFASGGLDEYEIAQLLHAGAPIDGFGVGTGMGVSDDAPALDMAYKLAEYDGKGRLKTSPGKPILPGRKQVYRVERQGRAEADVIARWDEAHDGRPLLRQVLRGGERVAEAADSLDSARQRAREEIGRLPETIRATEFADRAYSVHLSPALAEHQQDVRAVVAT